jgi:hypothetical protein
MSSIELTGLVGSNPLGALASFGLLLVLAPRDPSARLSFVERDDFVAVLDSAFEDRAALLAFLRGWGRERAPKVLEAFGDDDVRVEPNRFHEMLRLALGDDAAPEVLPMLCALAADGARDQSKGLVKPSPFYMASGQQSFLATMKKLLAYVREGALWQEALFGPWTYATPEWGAGWDPGTERMHALRFKAPTKDKTSCVAGAVWLAFEALPLLPTFSNAQRVQTVGWDEHDEYDHFVWPLPGVPSSLGAISVLVAAEWMPKRRAPNGNASSSANERARNAVSSKAPPVQKREGVAAVYESRRHEFGQGYAVFRPAHRLV